VKNCLLALMMIEHASIAVVLGLPFFSLAMITADAIFLPTGFLRWAGDRLSGSVRRRRQPADGTGPDPKLPRPTGEPTPSNLVG
jgi:hypothetical protein